MLKNMYLEYLVIPYAVNDFHFVSNNEVEVTDCDGDQKVLEVQVSKQSIMLQHVSS